MNLEDYEHKNQVTIDNLEEEIRVLK